MQAALRLGSGLHEIVKATIDELQVQPKSIMPEGLEKQWSEQDFLDLIAFLIAQRG